MYRLYKKMSDGLEYCFYIESSKPLNEKDLSTLKWLIADKHQPDNLHQRPFLSRQREDVAEFGPLLHVVTPFSTNAVSICHSCNIPSITRLERFRRIALPGGVVAEEFIQQEFDKMTEGYYLNAPLSLTPKRKPEPTAIIPVMEQGIDALREANKKYGTGMDDFDLKYYLYLFTEAIKRNPTEVEWRDLGNSNSEHSRHHVFRAKIIIDGEEMPFTLMELIQSTLTNPSNSIIAFHDNASAIRGYPVKVLIPERPGMPSPMRMAELLYHYVLTCETHNHPCLWQAYQGAGTGRGGRGRDNQAPGRGGIVVAGSAGFFGGNLNIPGYPLQWEDSKWPYDPRVETGLSFLINATNGAYDDGNQFGEPTILGFTRSFGLNVGGERIENIKPIMFSGGFGFIDDRHVEKHEPQEGWLIVKYGGLAYAVGEGGGSASSMLQGQNTADLDFKSVQRADGEMAQKTNRVSKTCIDMGEDNPIENKHDQGAGGNGNVLKEIADPAGAKIYLRNIPLGDQTMSQTQIWIAEYQENLAVLIKPERWDEFEKICLREKCPCAIVGTITGDGKFVVIDEQDNTTPFDLDLNHIFGDYPQKTYEDKRKALNLPPLDLPKELSITDTLQLVFQLLDVGSKEALVSKVDHSVTGKVVQAQPVGPLSLPLSNHSVIAPSPWDNVGEANSVALRPSIGLISPEAMARMTAASALLKLMGVPVSARNEIKASVNWMLAAKLPGGMAWLYDAALAYRDFANKIGLDTDGGKDSMSLAAEVEGELIRSINTMVLSTYAACPDFNFRVTPDIKSAGHSRLMYLDLAKGKMRLGGSALAHVHGQVGNECPDVEDNELFNSGFDACQTLIKQGLIQALHKRTRGGLITTLCEMAFAGNCGLHVSIDELTKKESEVLPLLFNEELGLVIECLNEDLGYLFEHLSQAGLVEYAYDIGYTTTGRDIDITYNDGELFNEEMPIIREWWRATNYKIEEYQTSKSCVTSLRQSNAQQGNPPYLLTFDPNEYPPIAPDAPRNIDVAIIREEGSNSDEEMKTAFFLAGFNPWDITMTDIAESRITLDRFKVIALVGGFSFKDVFGAAKGWAGVIKFNPRIADEFSKFFAQDDTLSLGDCNGCQLMVNGIVPWNLPETKQVAFVDNDSGRFEARFPTVKIYESPAIMLRGMAGSILGVHCAHGEGKYICPDQSIAKIISNGNLAPIRFVDANSMPTNKYPLNPNGSTDAITALCTPDGRHLAFMEHPERTVLKRQWDHWPKDWKYFKYSPWLRMFQNARLYYK